MSAAAEWSISAWFRMALFPLLRQTRVGTKPGNHIYTIFYEGSCFYVGQTTVGLRTRLMQHINQKSELGMVLAMDAAVGRELTCDLFEVVGDLDTAERYFISIEEPQINTVRYLGSTPPPPTEMPHGPPTVIQLNPTLALDTVLAPIYGRAFRDPNHPDLRA